MRSSVVSTSSATSLSSGVAYKAIMGRRLDRGEFRDPAFLVDRDAARQGGGDLQICLQNLLGLVRIADPENPALVGKRHALLGQLGLEVVHAEDAELVAGHGLLQIFATRSSGLRDSTTCSMSIPSQRSAM
jgi:hypothetical protein